MAQTQKLKKQIVRRDIFDTNIFINEEFGLLILSIEVWMALDMIRQTENIPFNDLIQKINSRKPKEISLTKACQVFVLNYFMQMHMPLLTKGTNIDEYNKYLFENILRGKDKGNYHNPNSH